MTKPDKAKIILQAIKEAYPIPGYMEEDVSTAIVKALVMIEREEDNDDT